MSINKEILANYSRALRRRLRDDSIQRLIPLEVRVAGTPERYGVDEQTVSLSSVTDRRVALLGNPGAGKSTALRQLCLAGLDNEEHPAVPVYVDLKRYSVDRRSIADLFGAQVALLADSGVVAFDPIVFDGLNEAPEGTASDILSELEDFADARDARDARVVVSCRTIDFPSTVSSSFSRYEVASVPELRALEYLGVVAGDVSASEQVWRRLSPHVRELCRSPLLLGMLGYLIASRTESLTLPSSRNAMYAMFLAEMEQRTRDRVPLSTPEDIRDSCLAYLAYRIGNARVESSVRELKETVTEFFDPRWGIPINTFQREVLDYPPMGSTETVGGRRGGATRSFMHQTFQEYFTAKHIHAALAGRTQHKKLNLSDLTPLLQPDAITWRETFGFLSGMLPDSTPLVDLCRREDNLALTCLCIRTAETVSDIEVDNLVCDTLDRFKYGAIFDYDLIIHLVTVLERASPSMPSRVAGDVRYWHEKYSNMTAQTLPNNLTDSDLIGIAQAGSQAERFDAVWTLGQRRARTAVLVLEEFVRSDPDDLLREQSVVALGRIGANESLNLLRETAMSAGETKWNRAYSLHAFGSYLTTEAVQVLMDCLEDPVLATFAEDAAWAVAAIAKQSPALIEPRVDQLFSFLTRGADAYTRGCILFALACGEYTNRADEIVSFLRTERDPFVLEDGAHALAVLGGGEGAVDLLSGLCDPSRTSDAMARRHAVVALRALNPSANGLRLAASDPAPFVRRAVKGLNI